MVHWRKLLCLVLAALVGPSFCGVVSHQKPRIRTLYPLDEGGDLFASDGTPGIKKAKTSILGQVAQGDQRRRSFGNERWRIKGHKSRGFIYPTRRRDPSLKFIAQVEAYNRLKETQVSMEDSNAVPPKSNVEPSTSSVQVDVDKLDPKWFLIKSLSYPIAYASTVDGYSLILQIILRRLVWVRLPNQHGLEDEGTERKPRRVKSLADEIQPMASRKNTSQINLSQDVGILNQILRLRVKELREEKHHLDLVLIGFSAFVSPMIIGVLIYLLAGF